jgi:hypothetical protein
MTEEVDRKMCLEAVSILANAGSSANIIIERTLKECKNQIKVGTYPDHDYLWTKYAKSNDWVIEHYKFLVNGYVRLINLTSKIDVSLDTDEKLKEFLPLIIRVGEEESKISDWLSNMALDKDGEFIVLLGRMGAKHISSVSLDKKNDANNGSGSINVGLANIGMDIYLKNDIKKFKRYDVHIEDNTVNFSDDLLNNSKWFKNDSVMNALFIMLKEKKKIRSWEYKSSLSENSDINFSIEAQKIGVAEVNLKNAFERRKNVYREFTVEFQ